MVKQGVPVEILAVTDGEASHPDLDLSGRQDLASARARETWEGLRRLGWEAPVVRRAELPDGRVSAHIGALCELLDEVLAPNDLCLAPWRKDGHPDHDACGQAAALVAHARGADLLQYLVWTWHWADPDGDDLPWDDCRRFDFSRRVAATKRWSCGAFLTQIRPMSTDANELVLPAPILRRFWRTFEVFIEGGAER
jgi:LmbE family N-acetylglucosaminyl deacetylase